jgi:peptidylprolyl isomerase
MKSARSATALAAASLMLILAACGDDNPFQVIEETEFAASLGVDLETMEKLPSGVYIQDIELGTGDELVYEATMTVTYTGWLADGTEFDSGTFTDVLLEGAGVIDGFGQGVLGMQPGGTRLIVIPPEEAYGDRQVGAIPPGSILVFRVTLDDLVLPG